jgi:hypothetical protein
MNLFFYPARCRLCRRWTWRCLGTRELAVHLYRNTLNLCPASGHRSVAYYTDKGR